MMDNDDIEKLVYNQSLVTVDNKDVVVSDTSNTVADITDVIDGLVTDEVRRLKKNLNFIDTLEDELKRQVQQRIDYEMLDLSTLQKVIATMNKSVERSNNLIQDKKSNLTQILIDAHTENINIPETSEDKVDDTPQLSLASRKRLRAFIEALSSTGDDFEK